MSLLESRRLNEPEGAKLLSYQRGFLTWSCVHSVSPYVISIVRIEANPAAQMRFPGLEHDFWEIIKRSPLGITVETVFTQFLGGHHFEPEDNLVKRLIQWMIQLGYGQPDTSPKPFFRMSSNIQMFEKFAPDCRRIAVQEQAAQIIHRRWMKFRAEEPEVFYYLFDDVVDAALNRIGNEKRRFASHYWRADNRRNSGTP